MIDSLIDGSNADGPGGAIFTLDGDVAVLDSTLIGNRADDRGGAISGEADVLVVNSTIARNLAVAHAGGGVWARGDLVLVNSTVTDNYAEGEGGGVLAAGRTTLLSSTVSANIASIAANVGSAGVLRSSGSIIGPAQVDETTGDTRPTRRSCRVYRTVSGGHNFVTDDSCELHHATDILGTDPQLRRLEDDPKGFVLTPFDSSPVRAPHPGGRVPAEAPRSAPRRPAAEALRRLGRGALARRRRRGPRHGRRLRHRRGRVAPAPDRATRRRPYRPRSPAGGGAPPAAVAASAPPAAVRPGGLTALSRRIDALDAASRRFGELLRCTTEVPVDQAGDTAHRWGFRYDERDGTGIDHRPALVRHRGRGRPDLRFLRLSRAKRCLSAAPDPQGTARAAAARPSLRELRATVARIERRTKRFDAWESCLSWLPVTEAGDRSQDLGFLRGKRHDTAIDLDTSEWDDPDYQLMAFVGRDRPFHGECDTEPGEGFDGLPARAAAADALEEDVDDLVEPVGDITRFDECLYTVGARDRGGYAFRSRAGAARTPPRPLVRPRPPPAADGPDGLPGRGAAADRVQRGRRRPGHRGIGGGGGIRTLGAGVTHTTVFETARFNHSRTPPRMRSGRGMKGYPPAHRATQRFDAKNARSSAAHSSASSPPVTSGRWLRRGSARTSSTLPAAPALGSAVP